MRVVLSLGSCGQPEPLKLAGTGITKNVHFDPLFMRLVHIKPAVGCAGIIEKLPLAACTGCPAHFDSFRSAHCINLPSAMSFVYSFKRIATGSRSCILHEVGESSSMEAIPLYVERAYIDLTDS